MTRVGRKDPSRARGAAAGIAPEFTVLTGEARSRLLERARRSCSAAAALIECRCAAGSLHRVSSMAAILRAFGGYLFLVAVVRLVGRRPGRQITPFEFVIIFFIGGLALTAIVGDDGSLTNALSQIIAISVAHYLVTFAKSRSPYVARIFDGTALTLLSKAQWHAVTMHKTRMQNTDVASAAREQGLRSIDDVATAILERNGEISIEAK